MAHLVLQEHQESPLVDPREHQVHPDLVLQDQVEALDLLDLLDLPEHPQRVWLLRIMW
jgi:hypothetical protein